MASTVGKISNRVLSVLAGALLGLWETWRALSPQELGLIALASLLLGGANYLIVIAFRGADISVVAPFRYSILLWAGIVGFVVMLSAATIGVTSLRNPAMLQQPMRETRHEGFGVVDGGRSHRPKMRGLRRPGSSSPSGSFMDRMEERWRHRRDQGRVSSTGP